MSKLYGGMKKVESYDPANDMRETKESKEIWSEVPNRKRTRKYLPKASGKFAYHRMGKR
jgi:hypothetical protein